MYTKNRKWFIVCHCDWYMEFNWLSINARVISGLMIFFVWIWDKMRVKLSSINEAEAGHWHIRLIYSDIKILTAMIMLALQSCWKVIDHRIIVFSFHLFSLNLSFLLQYKVNTVRVWIQSYKRSFTIVNFVK